MQIHVTNIAEARKARTELQGFLSATKPVLEAPSYRIFNSVEKVEAHKWNRQFARSTGGAHLDAAIGHLERGTAGAWTQKAVATLRADRLAIGDGMAPVIVAAEREHARAAVRDLSGPLRSANVKSLAWGMAGLGVAVAAAWMVGAFEE